MRGFSGKSPLQLIPHGLLFLIHGISADPLQSEALLTSGLHLDRSRRCAPGALRPGQFRPVALLPRHRPVRGDPGGRAAARSGQG
jgi:hypothetical protein